MKEMQEDTKKWKYISCHGWEAQNIVKMSTLLKTIYTCHEIPITLTKTFVTEQIISKFVWNDKSGETAKTNLKKKSKAGDITLPDFKLYYKAVLIRTVLYWQNNNNNKNNNNNNNNNSNNNNKTQRHRSIE